MVTNILLILILSAICSLILYLLYQRIQDKKTYLKKIVEEPVDKVLLELINKTTDEYFQLYLSKSAKVMVDIFMDLYNKGIAKYDTIYLSRRMEAARREIVAYANSLNQDIKDYNNLFETNYKDELTIFQDRIFKISKHGNGSKNKEFAEFAVEYICKQLNFAAISYKSFQQMKVHTGLKIKNINKRTFHKLVENNEIDTLFDDLSDIISKKNDNQLAYQCTLLQSQYNLYKQNKLIFQKQDSDNEYIKLTARILSFTDSLDLD